MGCDLLSVLEAIYSETEDEAAWLRGLMDAAAPSLDCGLGVMVGTYRLASASSLHSLQIDHATGACADWARRLVGCDFASALSSRPDAGPLVRRIYPSQPACGLFSRMSRLGPGWRHDPTFGPFWELAGAPMKAARDVFGVLGTGASHAGPVLVSAERSVDGPSAQAKAAWTRIASHLATGYRLLRTRSARPDAVLDPCGRVEHLGARLTRPEQASLSEATRAIEVARGRLRRSDPARALALWRGLVSGQWTLVDHFDSDGRRYVLGRRNVRERPWNALSKRELSAVALAAKGHPHKVIASALGMPPTSVSAHLTRAARKVGAASRIELVSAYRAAHGEAEASA